MFPQILRLVRYQDTVVKNIIRNFSRTFAHHGTTEYTPELLYKIKIHANIQVVTTYIQNYTDEENG